MRYLLEQLCAMAVRSAPRAIRRHRVLELTGIGKSHMYNLLDEKSPAFDPTFPRPFRLGTSTNAPAVWWEHQVVAWLQCKAAAAERERCISSKKLVRRVSGVSQLRSEELQ
ncbi:helix-turn-helix transcriptional regulator [Burkholderia vietnamiensis]|uniref:helix-turn-helix transcriptional regulator n=1 Tax=Burkholderia vietnamiensis TaxID=60552 RepID=UPI001593F611|nr:AlpA family phage regulatory protein [Burkholderia vietnamiensis]